VIREATEADLGEIHAMILELAEFEELSDEVVCSEADLAAALFCPRPVARVSLAVADDGTVAGQALWYPTFSTFLGKPGIWLEDLFVRPAHRRRGVARALLEHLRASTEARVEWEVVDWNDGAIALYERLGAVPLRGWTKYRWVPRG
jgi:GNAT superfamily N-acetyltransferase